MTQKPCASQSSIRQYRLFLEVTFLYFLQGIPYGFQVKYLPLILRQKGHSLDIISFINLVSLPWIFKFSWANSFDVYGGNGRLWITGCLFLLSIISGVLSCAIDILWLSIAILFLLSFFTASLDIGVDALAIRHFKSKDLGYCNIGHIVGYKVGILIGGGVLVWLHQEVDLTLFSLGLSSVYLVSAIFFATSHSVLFSAVERTQPDRKTQNVDKVDKTGLLLSVFFTAEQMYLILFVFIYKLGEQGFVSMYPLFLVDIGLPIHHIGIINGLFGQICSMTGSTLGGLLISKFGLQVKSLLLKTSSMRCLMLLIYSTLIRRIAANFLIHAILDCIFQLLAGMMTTLTFTLMMMSSKMLPGNTHATHFTILAAFEVFGKLLMKSVSGSLTTNVGFSNFFLFCCSLDFLVVALLFIICKAGYTKVKSISDKLD